MGRAVGVGACGPDADLLAKRYDVGVLNPDGSVRDAFDVQAEPGECDVVTTFLDVAMQPKIHVPSLPGIWGPGLVLRRISWDIIEDDGLWHGDLRPDSRRVSLKVEGLSGGALSYPSVLRLDSLYSVSPDTPTAWCAKYMTGVRFFCPSPELCIKVDELVSTSEWAVPRDQRLLLFTPDVMRAKRWLPWRPAWRTQ